MSNDRSTREPGNQLMLEQVRTFHRRSEAQTILDMLMAQPILSADEAREVVRLRLESLTNAEDSLAIRKLIAPEVKPS